MKNRADEIRRRHEQRKKQRLQSAVHDEGRAVYMPEPGEREDDFSMYKQSNSGYGDRSRPLFKKERVIVRIMAAVCLFLVVGVLFKHPNPSLNGARMFVQDVFQREFQFAMVANWYEEQFGKPLALFPSDDNTQLATDEGSRPQFAIPANVSVLQGFEDNGQGIMLETRGTLAVESVKQGLVIKVENSEELGKKVIIQHPDNNESVYAKLESVSVDLYDYVKSGQKIGTATPTETGDSGTFYFALKQEGNYIDPLKVIEFD